MAATFWGSGLAVAGIGAGMHSLPMLYAGYGLLGGLGFAFGYISPVANLMRWFPDKKGVATGLGVSFFGESRPPAGVPPPSWPGACAPPPPPYPALAPAPAARPRPAHAQGRGAALPPRAG